MKIYKLKNKIIISIIPVVLLLGLLASLGVYYYASQKSIDWFKDDLRIISIEKSGELSEIFRSSELILDKLSKSELISEYIKEGTIEIGEGRKKILNVLESYNIGNRFSALYIIGTNGNTLVSTESSFEGKNYGFRDYFLEAIKKNRYVDASVGVTSGELGYYFSNKIEDKQTGDALGVAVIKMKPEVISSVLEKGFYTEGTSVMFVDKYGIVIYSYRDEDLYNSIIDLTATEIKEIKERKRYPDIEEVKYLQYSFLYEAVKSKERMKIYDFYDEKEGIQKILSISSIDNYPFYFIAEIPKNKAVEGMQNVAIILGLSVLFFVVVFSLIISLFTSHYLKPLEIIEKAILKISKGYYRTKIKKTSNDELGNLIVAFNEMAGNILKSRKEVDEKVEQQTKELVQKKEDVANQKKAILNILEDVEEEKEYSERLARDYEKFKLAVDSTSDHVVITNPDGVILYANKAVEEITGYTSEEIIGKKAGVWGHQMSDNFYKKFWRKISIEKKPFVGEITNKRKDGSLYDVAATVSPILDKEGNVEFFVGIERDITKEKEIENAKTEFVSLASHQLRTPLTAIKLFAEMLVKENAGKLNKKQKEYTKDIQASTERMIRLVNDLLNVSRIETGQLKIEPKPYRLEELIRNVLEEAEALVGSRKCDLVFNHIESKELPEAMIDPVLLRQVIHNLITNAIRYSGNGGDIIVDLKAQNDGYEISVKDSGIGIPEEAKSRVFEKFYRAENAVNVEAEGTGLGMYMAKMIMTTSGGDIWFESKEGQGTTFYVKIPKEGMLKKQGEKSLLRTKKTV